MKHFIKYHSQKRIMAVICAAIVSISIIANISCLAYAAVRQFNFSEIGTAVSINSDLYAVTPSTTSADSALGILDVSVEELQVMLKTNNIYLEAFPEDMSFEILLTGKKVSDDVSDYSIMTDAEILNSVEHNSNGKYSIETINGIKYLVSEVSSDEPNNTYYTYKYTTIDRKIATTLSLQAEKKPGNEVLLYFKEAANSLERKEIKSSITENLYFTELATTFAGVLIVIGGLGLILFLFIRMDKKSRKSSN